MIKQFKFVGICLLVFAFSTFAYFFVRSIFGADPQLKEVQFVKLESFDDFSENQRFKAISISPIDEKKLYVLEQTTGSLISQNQENGLSEKTHLPIQDAEIIAANNDGNFYVSDSSSGIKLISANGRLLNKIPITHATSFSVYENNLIAASSSGNSLLHLFDKTGNLQKSFGDLKDFDSNNSAQNSFLNSGKIAISPQGEIYYAYTFAPEPSVRKYSFDGKLLSEFRIEGSAINLQLKREKDFLKTKDAATVGGMNVITSIAHDARTNHIFIGTNGGAGRSGITRNSGVIYEYDTDGQKLREYALINKTKISSQEVIIGLKDIVVAYPWIHILTSQGRVHKFNLEAGTVIEKSQINVDSINFQQLEGADCPQEQSLVCKANCPANSAQPSVDCAANIRQRMGQNDRIVGGSCSLTDLGCNASANLCDTTNGDRVSVSSSLECPPPTPRPRPGGCLSESTTSSRKIPIEDSSSLCSNCSPTADEIEFCRTYGGYDYIFCDCASSPIVIDVLGDGFNLTNAANGVKFDLKGDDLQRQWSWTAVNSDDAWLALDRNNNGRIDSGKELFGNFTAQAAPPAGEQRNGFIALAKYDKTANGGNNDYVIDARDGIFTNLRLWQDRNHNGFSETAELHNLPELGVAELELKYKESKRTDEHGNQFRYRAKVKVARGAQVGRWAWDVYLKVAK